MCQISIINSKKGRIKSCRFSNVLFVPRVAGFEPANDGIRIRCLTAWRYPIKIVNKQQNSGGGI